MHGMSIGDLGNRFGVLIVWALVVAIFSILRPSTYPTTANFQTIFGSQGILMVLTLGIILSLTAAEFDLSFGGVMSVSLTLVGYLNVLQHWPVGFAVAAAMAFGLAVGLVHAFFIVFLGVESIVVTLGSGTFLYGIGVAINGVATAGISTQFVEGMRHQIFGLPMTFYYAVLLTTLVWYVFSYTPFGRYLYFVGASREVARLSGLRVQLIRTCALVGTSVFSALAGVMLAGTLGAADPNIASGYLLPTFAAAFLGSTVIVPGRFNAWGSFVAVYFLISGITGLELLGYSGWVENVFYGASLVVAVTLARLSARHQQRRRAARAADDVLSGRAPAGEGGEALLKA